MAISFVNSSVSFVASQTSVVVTLPSSVTTGDMLVIFIGGKQYNATIATPSGWTSIGTSTNGTTNANTDVGSTKLQAFYKVATASEPSTINFSISGGSGAQNVFMGVCQAFRTNLTGFNTPIGTGVLQSTATGWTTMQSASTLSLPVGAYLPTMFVSHTDVSFIGTTPTYSATGRTFSGGASSPISAFTTTLGGDGGAVSYYINVSAASNSTAQTLNITTSGPSTDKGHAYVVQLTDYAQSNGKFFQFF
jgi:hypothetical protein